MAGGLVGSVVSSIVPPLIEAAKIASFTILGAVLILAVSVFALRRVIRLFQPTPGKSVSQVVDSEYKEFSTPTGFDDDDWFDNGDTTLGRNFKF